jgi:ribosomal protein S18 acetylase RimI-like enzyme
VLGSPRVHREPACTPGHRRLGLGRAVNLFALERLREEGAQLALVACRGDDAYPIPRKLYESVGFGEWVSKRAFRRPASSFRHCPVRNS